MAQTEVGTVESDRPRIAFDIHGTVVKGDLIDTDALDIVEELVDRHLMIIFTGKSDIPDSVWNVVKAGECRKPLEENPLSEGREWKLSRNRVWKFDILIDSDRETLHQIDVPIGLHVEDVEGWRGVRNFLNEYNSETAEGVYDMREYANE